MDTDSLAHHQTRLKARIQALKEAAETNADSRNSVTLDQTSVGRLSRMDALQQQAMAKATQARREAEMRQLRAALQRIKDEEFGYCEDCGDDIPEARLKISLTATKCVPCARL